MSDLTLECFPRLHFGLLDTARFSGRLYGGCGISISGPSLLLRARKSGVSRVLGGSLSGDERSALEKKISHTPFGGVQISILREIPRHIGLGSGTALSMACISSAMTLYNMSLSREEILRLSGRAGASGIGYHSFFDGGFIVDAGQPDCGQNILPSSSTSPLAPPPLLANYRVPEDWRAFIIVPKSLKKFHGESEAGFFRAHTPTPESEVPAAISALYALISVGILEADIETLRRGLILYQSVGLKKREIDNQSSEVRELLRSLEEVPDCAFGMSSMGPVVFVICSAGSQDLVERDLLRRIPMHNCLLIGTYGMRNSGYRAAVAHQEDPFLSG